MHFMITDKESRLHKGGPYIGPRGGLWEDSQHTIPYKKPTTTSKIVRAKDLPTVPYGSIKGDFRKEMDRRRKEGLAIGGDTYAIKDEIKRLGGVWDKYEKEWLVPDKQTLTALRILNDETKKGKSQKSKSFGAEASASGGTKASSKQISYAGSLINKLKTEDYGSYTTFGLQHITMDKLQKMSAKEVSKIIDVCRDELYR